MALVRRIMTVVGARPQFIKAAAVSRVLKTSGFLKEMLVHTGQHFDENMSEVFFAELGIPAPAYNLEVSGGTHGVMTARMLERLEAVMLENEPDAVLVYGDTNSTLAGALAAAKLHIPAIHVEAGLRSFNRAMPEEINRVIVDHISSLLLCPTALSVANLKQENIENGVSWVGDVMYDTTLYVRDSAMKNSTITERFGLKDKQFGLCTLHRAENTNNPARFARILDYIADHSRSLPLVFPVHPRVGERVRAWAKKFPQVTVIDPVGYLDMHRLLAGASTVLTDSGGLQKEAYFHRAPCITIRDETEWVETIRAGWNRLWTVPDFEQRHEISEYGDGNAAQKIVERIVSYLNSGS
jgi:UDP-GlcNAc3NAcA epimerase